MRTGFYAYARYDLGIVKDYDSMKGTLLENIFRDKPVDPVAVNPDKKLQRLARANGWRIEAIAD